MSSHASFTTAAPLSREATAARRSRLFYSVAAAVLLVLTFLGFRHFYAHGQAYPGRPLTPPIRTLIIAHGSAMAGWMLLSLVQPLLIAGRNAHLHRKLGWLGAALALSILVLGWQLGIASTRVNPPELRIWGLPPRQFMIVPIVSVVVFAGFVLVGVLNRRRPDWHRPLMLLASLAAMPAAVSRIDFLSQLYVGTAWEKIFGPSLWTLAIGLAFLLVKWALTRKWDACFALGNVLLIVVAVLMMKLAPTPAWDAVASLLLR